MGSIFAWIQAWAPALQAIAAMLGVIGLFIYVRSTITIAKASIRQSEIAIRPFVYVIQLKPRVVTVRNAGPGTAVNVRLVRRLEYVGDDIHLGTLASGQSQEGYAANKDMEFCGAWDGDVPEESQGVDIFYTDLAGKCYKSRALVIHENPDGRSEYVRYWRIVMQTEEL